MWHFSILVCRCEANLEADEDDDHHDIVVPLTRVGRFGADHAQLGGRVVGEVDPAEQVSPRVQSLIRPPEQT